MKVNFGCGSHRVAGFLGVDKRKTNEVDLICDLSLFPYPFKDNSVDGAFLNNILEHLPDTVGVMEEIHRICKDSALVEIVVPYYNSPGAFHDPTHVRFFTEHTFDYFSQDNTGYYSAYNYYSSARYKIICQIPSQRGIFGLLPIRLQWFLAHHLCTTHSIRFVLKVLKEKTEYPAGTSALQERYRPQPQPEP